MSAPRRLLLALTATALALVAGDAAQRRGEPGQARPGSRVRRADPGAPRPRGAQPPRGTQPPRGAPPSAGAAAALPRPRAQRVAPVCGRVVLFGLDEAPRAGDLPRVARDLLEEQRDALGLDDIPGELRLAREMTTLSGHHLRLRQFVGGVPVEGSEVSVHVARDGRPLLAQADVFPVGDVPTRPTISADDALAAARALVADPDDDAAGTSSFEAKAPVLFVRPEGGGGRLVWRVDVRTADESLRVSVDAADGDVAAVRDLRVGAEALGRVFQPNPLFSSKDARLTDRRDAPLASLQKLTVVVTLRRLDGTHRLRGTWCDTARGAGDAYNPFDDWRQVTRADNEFESMNAYWHVDLTQERLQALGVTDANANQQDVDTHAISSDQSYYDVFDDLIRFGTGGVDDAEDGDVVVHEYGHAIQYDQVEDFGATLEGASIGEGFGDYLACEMHADPAAPSPAWDPLVASWDATSYSNANPPFLRRVDRTKSYPRDLEDEPHADGELWSRFLWDLRALVGPDDGLRVVAESHFFLTSGARFLHGANAVLAANRSIRGGRDDQAIRGLLRARGFTFSEPPVGAPPEDSHEDNDTPGLAVPLATGAYSDLLLADDDWFEVSLPPLRRFVARASFDPADVNLDLELRTPAGALVAHSRGVSGQESVSASAGGEGAVFLVRAFRPTGSVGISGYSLALLDVAPETLRPGATNMRVVTAAAPDVVAIDVLPEKAGTGRRLVVTASSRRGGAVGDVRITSPSGVVAAEFGEGSIRAGARVKVPLTEPGAWRIEVRPRSGTSGKYTLQAKLR